MGAYERNTITEDALRSLRHLFNVPVNRVGVAWAEGTWADELTNSLNFYQANYPNSNWDSYMQKLTTVKDALGRGDQRTVRVEMGKWFKMLRNRDYGISEIAADELYNFAVMVTPLQEYGISLPSPMPDL